MLLNEKKKKTEICYLLLLYITSPELLDVHLVFTILIGLQPKRAYCRMFKVICSCEDDEQGFLITDIGLQGFSECCVVGFSSI